MLLRAWVALLEASFSLISLRKYLKTRGLQKFLKLPNCLPKPPHKHLKVLTALLYPMGNWAACSVVQEQVVNAQEISHSASESVMCAVEALRTVRGGAFGPSLPVCHRWFWVLRVP